MSISTLVFSVYDDLSIVFEGKKIRNYFADGEHWISWKDVKFLLGLGETMTAWVPKELMIKGLKNLNTVDAHKMIAAIEGEL